LNASADIAAPGRRGAKAAPGRRTPRSWIKVNSDFFAPLGVNMELKCFFGLAL
jgi:hypothetical protein